MVETKTLKVGEIFTIERESNRGSTGYDSYLVKLDGGLALINEEYKEPATPLHGAHGIKVFTFEALKKGTAALQLAKFRPWKGSEAIYEDVLPYDIQEGLVANAIGEATDSALGLKAGGWKPFAKPDSGSLNVFKDALAKLVGVDYDEPLLVSTQTVNGTNYAFVTNGKIPGGGQRYAVLIRIYQAPNEKPAITGIHRIGHPGFQGSYGAFAAATSEAQDALKDAQRLGLHFEGQFVATQVVAGTNYLFAGNAKPLTLKGIEYPAFVTVYQSPEGKAQITSVRAVYEA
jgi:predicted secreted protein